MRIELPSGKPASPSDLLEHASNADVIAKRAEGLRDRFTTQVTQIRDEVEAQFAPMTGIDPGQKRELVRLEMRRRMDEARNAAMAEADKVLRELGPLVAAADTAAPLYADKIRVIDRITLAKPERATYSANLANAGPVALANAAAQALATNDLALVSAVIARLQSMPVADRPFTPHQLADRFEVAEHAKATEALTILRNRTQAGILATREIRSPASGPIGRIMAGLRNRPAANEED
jgi:hypothetical protein